LAGKDMAITGIEADSQAGSREGPKRSMTSLSAS